MSKTDKQPKSSTTSQFRKDLTQASKSLQAITSSLEKLENSFTECETVLSREKALRDENLALREKADELQRKCHEVQRQHELQIASFAGANKFLVLEYERRSTKALRESETTRNECQRQLKSQELEWNKRVAAEKVAARLEMENGSKAQRDVEMELRNKLEAQQHIELQFQKQRQQMSEDVTELKRENEELKARLNTHEAVSTGKNAEIQILEGRLASIEAFRLRQSADEVGQIINRVQAQVRHFCINCVDSSEGLPGWNQLPDGIRFKHLPKVYSSESDAGRHVLVAAIQHSVCAVLNAHIFLPFRSYVSHETRAVAEAICRRNPSHEAIWRLMTVNALIGETNLLKSSRLELQRLASTLLVSWNPLVGEQERDHLCNLATDLFVEINTTWLNLMKFENRIYAVDQVSAAYFDSDSEEESYSVPGGFALPDSTSPVLCLFPAFWQTTKSDPTHPSLLRKGTAMFRDSPPLLVALNEAREVSSPRANHKKKMVVEGN